MKIRGDAILVAGLLALAASSAGAGEVMKPPPGAFVGPDWQRRPTSADLLAVYPTEAFKRGKSGKATIACNVTTQGALNNCTVRSETPEGAGFGAAAIALTPQFTMRPATLNGEYVASTAVIPITFKTNGAGAAAGSKKVLPPNLPWIEAPSYADVAAAYPKKAQASKSGGRATLICSMTEAGRLRDCSTVAVEPKGFGFEIAAKSLAKSFRLEVTSDSDRKATHSLVVHLPFTFDPEMIDAEHPVSGKPNWAAIPNAQQLSSAFDALNPKGTTRVVLGCKVRQGGNLEDCSVISEEPIGAGVGAAALGLTPAFRLTTWTTEGLPAVGSVVRIPIRYEGGEPEAAK